MTDSGRYERLADLFDRARKLAPPDRQEFLAKETGEDVELREELMELLAHAASDPGKTFLGNLVKAGFSASESTASTQIGSFRIERFLGRGGMGAVHLAVDERLGRTVAVKQIRSEFLGSQDARLRFQREARALSHLDHPNLCRVFEAGEVGGVPHVVMQYIEGDTLKVKLRAALAGDAPLFGETEGSTTDATTPSSRGEIFAIARMIERVARALHHAHENGFVHRDIKPGNIMLRRDGDPVVLDFGVVREEGADLTLTDSFQQLGTPSYMAPEQITQSTAVDRRTDVFALGVTLYECLTLQPPFRGASRQELFGHILRDEPVGVSRLNRRVPRDLAVIVGKAMEKEPSARYDTALELAEDLERAQQHEPIRARRAGPLLRLQRWVRRNPLAASTILAVTGGLAVSVFLLGQRNEAITAATKNLENFRRLGLITVLDDLETTAAELHPAWPEHALSLREWCARADALVTELPELRLALAGLRTHALPLTEADEQRQREHHPLRLKMIAAINSRQSLRGQLRNYQKRPDSELRAHLMQRYEETKARIAALKAVFDDRWVYRFADQHDQYLHDALVELTRRLEAFIEPESGLQAGVRARLEWAETIRHRSIERPAQLWQDAMDAIAASDGVRASTLYGGLRITPQLGLVPIGMDPKTRLWEFHHLKSGAAAQRNPESGLLEVAEATGIVFVLIPPGTFNMGSQGTNPEQPNYDPQAQPGTSPVHPVKLSVFFLAKHEMTQAQWQRLAGNNPSSFWVGSVPFIPRPVGWTNPVETVNWDDCMHVLTDLGLWLPTEAQFEYACRAGTSTRWWTGDERESLVGTLNIADKCAAKHFDSARAWPEFEDGFAVHAPVDSCRPNPFGLHHIHSNVSEWCFESSVDYTMPPAPGDGRRIDGSPDRMVRGASYSDRALLARSAFRFGQHRQDKSQSIGLRAARAIRE